MIKYMKEITIKTPEGKEAKWVNNVLTLVDEQPVEFRFNYDDKVRFKGSYKELAIYRREAVNGKPHYWLKDEDGVPYPNHSESEIEIYTEPKDITERIKTFEDAKLWCTENGHFNLVREYDCIVTDTLILDEPTKDLIAYLKLRIITAALNEGWEPTFGGDEDRWYAVILDYGKNNKMETFFRWQSDLGLNQSSMLFLKAKALAEYAVTQFKDIYMDFCHKGKE